MYASRNIYIHLQNTCNISRSPLHSLYALVWFCFAAITHIEPSHSHVNRIKYIMHMHGTLYSPLRAGAGTLLRHKPNARGLRVCSILLLQQQGRQLLAPSAKILRQSQSHHQTRAPKKRKLCQTHSAHTSNRGQRVGGTRRHKTTTDGRKILNERTNTTEANACLTRFPSATQTRCRPTNENYRVQGTYVI